MIYPRTRFGTPFLPPYDSRLVGAAAVDGSRAAIVAGLRPPWNPSPMTRTYGSLPDEKAYRAFFLRSGHQGRADSSP